MKTEKAIALEYLCGGIEISFLFMWIWHLIENFAGIRLNPWLIFNFNFYIYVIFGILAMVFRIIKRRTLGLKI